MTVCPSFFCTHYQLFNKLPVTDNGLFRYFLIISLFYRDIISSLIDFYYILIFIIESFYSTIEIILKNISFDYLFV